MSSLEEQNPSMGFWVFPKPGEGLERKQVYSELYSNV
jgi:hypothetical protein